MTARQAVPSTRLICSRDYCRASAAEPASPLGEYTFCSLQLPDPISTITTSCSQDSPRYCISTMTCLSSPSSSHRPGATFASLASSANSGPNIQFLNLFRKAGIRLLPLGNSTPESPYIFPRGLLHILHHPLAPCTHPFTNVSSIGVISSVAC